MLWLRGAIFTILAPVMVAVLVPRWLLHGAAPPPGLWRVGWLLFGAGALLYFWCLARFPLAGGTPAVFFTRGLKFLIGEEPAKVVRRGPYRFSRNPMYVAVVGAILGQALAYRSGALLLYAAAASLVFHLTVVFLEEPHLRKARGPDYEQYFRSTPRWLGRRKEQSR